MNISEWSQIIAFAILFYGLRYQSAKRQALEKRVNELTLKVGHLSDGYDYLEHRYKNLIGESTKQ